MEPLVNQDKKLLVVDDDPSQLTLMARMLEGTEYEVLTARDGVEAMKIVLSQEPRVVLTDWSMPNMDGIQLCQALRQHEGVRFVYVIVATSTLSSDQLVQALEGGADDCIAKPINKAELIARLRAADRIVCAESNLAKRTREVHRVNAEMALTHQKLNQANEKLKMMATTDELTGLLNRREAMNRLNALWETYHRYGQMFSTVMLDIDHFKSFNDTHGHAAGDAVLRNTAKLLDNNSRKTDIVCRVGGEEFLVICPGVNVEGGAICAEHLREAVEQQKIIHEGVEMLVTISLGVAQPSSDMDNPDELLKRADEALYASKEGGRNQVTVAEVAPVK